MSEEKTEWWQGFFTGPAAEVLKQLSTPDQTRKECDFLIQATELQPGSRLLDVPCGDGRLTLEFARRGYAATGIDYSAELIEDARSSASDLPAAHFDRADMRDLPRNGAFDLTFCFGNSFGYFSDEGNRAFLESVRGAIRPGGVFILESRLVAEVLFPQFQERRWFRFADSIMFTEASYDPAESVLTNEYSFLRDGLLDQRPSQFRIYPYRELVELTRSAGFVLLRSFGSMEFDSFRLGSSAAYLVLRR